MPSPSSPLDRIRTIAWYNALRVQLKTKTHFGTAEAAYDITHDEMITSDQCAKWSKGQRCSTRWIGRLNQMLPNIIRDTYDVGPFGESLWPAFRLPSSLYHTTTILCPPNRSDYPPRPAPTDYSLINKPIADLATAIAEHMIAAENLLFAVLQDKLDNDSAAFSAMAKKTGLPIPDPTALLNRMEVVNERSAALIEQANNSKKELGLVGLSANIICKTAYQQFMHLVGQAYPNAPLSYLQQMKIGLIE